MTSVSCRDSSIKQEKIIPLSFVPAPIHTSYLAVMPAVEAGHIVREEILGSDRVLIVKQPGSLTLNAVVHQGNSYYQVGPIAFGNNSELINVGITQLFGKRLVRIQGYCDISCPIVYYLDLSDKWPTQYFFIGAGVREVDLDGDGLNELVASTGVPIVTTIYKRLDHDIVKANVNEALQKDSVSFSYDNRFVTYNKNQSVTSKYRFINNGLQLIHQ